MTRLFLRDALDATPKGNVSVMPPFFDSADAKTFADSIKKVLEVSGFINTDSPPGVENIVVWSAPGAFLLI